MSQAASPDGLALDQIDHLAGDFQIRLRRDFALAHSLRPVRAKTFRCDPY